MTKLLRTALLGLCLLVLAPTAAHAAVPGVNINGAPTPDRIQGALSTGAKQVRIFVQWAAFEPTSPDDFPNPRDVNLANLDATYKQAVATLNAGGAQPLFVVLGTPAWANGGAGPSTPPSDPTTYARFLAEFAQTMRSAGAVAGVEVWNEPDAAEFWANPSPAAYTGLLKPSYAAVKALAPDVPVITGPTTGNNYAWIKGLYDAGAKGAFDGVAVHTDTACSVVGPDSYYRDPNGRLGQFTFLAYREVRQTMLAAGDPKPIYMSELGWSTASGSCARGASAGKKDAGVTQAQQAEFLTRAYSCLAADSYVVAADWYTLFDDPAQGLDELRHYGLVGKPSLDAFKAIVASGGGTAAKCGDFGGPDLNVISPVEGQRYSDTLELKARAKDANAVEAIKFYVDGKIIGGSFGDDAALKAGPVGLPQWNGARKLPLGPHVIKVEAYDKLGNVSSKTINIVHVSAAQAGPGTLLPAVSVKKKGAVRCKGSTCTFSGALARAKGSSQTIPGKVAVQWQFKNKKGKWRKLVGGLKPANKPFSFKAKLKYKGAWRVRVVYKGVPPYKSVTGRWVTFRRK